MRSFFFALAMVSLTTLPASAKDILLPLNDDEQRVLVQLLDAATKAMGLQGAEAVVHFVVKIRAEQKRTEQVPTEPPK